MSEQQSMVVRVDEMLRIGCEARLQQIEEALIDKYGRVVQRGPFKGLVLAKAPHACPKILGTYEQELWPSIEKAISREPQTIFNVGCGEGYYGVGLKLASIGFPSSSSAVAPPRWNTNVVCIDTDSVTREQCLGTSVLNEAPVRFMNGPKFDADLLGKAVQMNTNFLIVMDCEGAELDYLSEDACKNLPNADLIIECHDFIGQPITRILFDRLSKTHDVDVITEGPRDTAALPELANLGSFDRMLAIQEFRPLPMRWIAAWARR